MDTQNPKYIIRTTRISVLPRGEPLFGECCTNVSIQDEASGEYLEIEQQSRKTDVKYQTIIIEPEEWQGIKEAVEFMLAEIRTHNHEKH